MAAVRHSFSPSVCADIHLSVPSAVLCMRDVLYSGWVCNGRGKGQLVGTVWGSTGCYVLQGWLSDHLSGECKSALEIREVLRKRQPRVLSCSKVFKNLIPFLPNEKQSKWQNPWPCSLPTPNWDSLDILPQHFSTSGLTTHTNRKGAANVTIDQRAAWTKGRLALSALTA